MELQWLENQESEDQESEDQRLEDQRLEDQRLEDEFYFLREGSIYAEKSAQRDKLDDLLQTAYSNIINFVESKMNVTLLDLKRAIKFIDPNFKMNQEDGLIIVKAKKIYEQLPKDGNKPDDEFLKYLKFDQEKGIKRAHIDKKEKGIFKSSITGYKIHFFIIGKEPEYKNIVTEAMDEALKLLDKNEKERLKNIRINIRLLNTKELSPGVQRQAIYTYDPNSETYEVYFPLHDIVSNTYNSTTSMQQYIKRYKFREEKEWEGNPNGRKATDSDMKAVVKHEFGHILHAILNPVNYRLSRAIDESVKDGVERYVSSSGKNFVKDKEQENLDKDKEQKKLDKENRWSYATAGIREYVAEIFVALTSGIKITDEQYNWYLEHGGPRMDEKKIKIKTTKKENVEKDNMKKEKGFKVIKI